MHCVCWSRDGCVRKFHFGYLKAELEIAPNKKTKSQPKSPNNNADTADNTIVQRAVSHD